LTFFDFFFLLALRYLSFSQFFSGFYGFSSFFCSLSTAEGGRRIFPLIFLTFMVQWALE